MTYCVASIYFTTLGTLNYVQSPKPILPCFYLRIFIGTFLPDSFVEVYPVINFRNGVLYIAVLLLSSFNKLSILDLLISERGRQKMKPVLWFTMVPRRVPDLGPPLLSHLPLGGSMLLVSSFG